MHKTAPQDRRAHSSSPVTYPTLQTQTACCSGLQGGVVLLGHNISGGSPDLPVPCVHSTLLALQITELAQPNEVSVMTIGL